MKPSCKIISKSMHWLRRRSRLKVSEKHSFSKLFSIVDRQWLLKDVQPTLNALI